MTATRLLNGKSAEFSDAAEQEDGRTLFCSRYNVVIQGNDGLVRCTRTNERFEDPQVLADETSALDEAIPRHIRRQFKCLRDLRVARGNNQQNFEAIVKSAWLPLSKGWNQLAVLIKSPTGVLQCQRLFIEEGIDALVTTNEQEAIDFLMRND